MRTVAEQSAAIRVERIQAPILLLSATTDEIAPTTPMCINMMARLQRHHFVYPYEHHAIIGGHGEPLKHFDLVFAFLKKNFPPN